MLYPQTNTHRQMIDLSGIWDFRFDPDDKGREAGWAEGFTPGEKIAVPASWNEQFAEALDYLGTGWYQTEFMVPWGWADQRIYLRFGSVNYIGEVWLNGHYAGLHEGGHLPFVLEISDYLRPGTNHLVVRVDAGLVFDRVPPGGLGGAPDITFGRNGFPDTNYDFYPYGGIQRPVLLYTTPPAATIEDITVRTHIDDTTGQVEVITTHTGAATEVRVMLAGHGADIRAVGDKVTLIVPDAWFWSPDAPNLYNLTVELLDSDGVLDCYTLRIGIRTIAVSGHQLLLNGQPVKLYGFGRHEDFPVVGKGYLPALIIKDFALMKWTGANSFRTTHYPYSEQQMQLADEMGFLVINETPAVGLFFQAEGLQKRTALCEQYIRELVARDKNHPSVILWSIANEPHIRDQIAAAEPIFRAQYALTKLLDPTRPVTFVSYQGEPEALFDFMDVVCLNRYHGWYYDIDRTLDRALAAFERVLNQVNERFGKPVLITEFGVDTIPGHHAIQPELFSEEYQAEFLERYIRLMDSKPFVACQHIWNLADFKTMQQIVRVNGLNYKGVFTRDRKPKMAAHRLRALWSSRAESE